MPGNNRWLPFGLLLIWGCSRSEARLKPEKVKAISQSLANVSTADGIDHDEANAIAEAYFAVEIQWECGAPGDPVREPAGWRVPLRFGATGRPAGNFLVDPATGAVGRFKSVAALYQAVRASASP